jgi:DNA-directed RNA polymerase subunit beta
LIEDAMDLDKGLSSRAPSSRFPRRSSSRSPNWASSKIKVVDTTVGRWHHHQVHEEGSRPRTKKRRSRIFIAASVPGDPPTAANARALIKRLFFDPKRYDLGRVGRYKINQKLGLKDKNDSRILTKEDLVAATKYCSA